MEKRQIIAKHRKAKKKDSEYHQKTYDKIKDAFPNKIYSPEDDKDFYGRSQETYIEECQKQIKLMAELGKI
eukprot:maker-scaffold_8-snap-gene-8.63-mRNA-1 protein AED:0.23 eAED:0.23 QI:99/1/1/1/1/1/2/13/70